MHGSPKNKSSRVKREQAIAVSREKKREISMANKEERQKMKKGVSTLNETSFFSPPQPAACPPFGSGNDNLVTRESVRRDTERLSQPRFSIREGSYGKN